MTEHNDASKTRRGFLRLSAASALTAGFSSASIQRALALPADHSTGTIEDVQHIVVLMQENRSFDHYFGNLRGVRGHNDRFPIALPNGRPVWFQPRAKDASQHILPFHLDTASTGAQAVTMLDHSWRKTHAAFAGGNYDAWPKYKTDMTMGFYTRKDVPFHYELADAFTVCDQYFCSVPGPTHPNRMYLMTGMIDPTGAGGGPLVDNVDLVDNPDLPPFTWTTYPERLEQAGINWQVYQQGLDWKDPYNGNYGLNVLQNFEQFINAPQGSNLQRRGNAIRTLDQFSADVKSGKLPQVSWIMPPAAFSEHPKYMPAYGATYISRILDMLTADPAVWSKTVLLVTYDENDGYFDHVVPPQPPTPVLPGISTVSTEGEIHDVVNPAHKPHYTRDDLPYGLGPRVPMMMVSPWSKGGYVCSQVFDHTSVIRFIEARFGVMEPNISPWRRAVCGDLTTAFDFSRHNAHPPRLPDTAGYRAKADAEVATLPAPSVPGPDQPASLLAQEEGIRPARALPYAIEVAAQHVGSTLNLHFANTGTQGTSFYVYQQGRTEAPWRYTVGAGASLDEALALPAGDYAFTVYGPNGFFRGFSRKDTSGSEVGLHVSSICVPASGAIHLIMENSGAAPVSCIVADNAYGGGVRHHDIAPGAKVVDRWNIVDSHHWYDLVANFGGQSWRLAGHMETGKISFSDPAAISPMQQIA
jgi:phospholipase C